MNSYIGDSVSIDIYLIDKNTLDRRVVDIFKRCIQKILDNMGLSSKHLRILNITIVNISENCTSQILYNFVSLIGIYFGI